MPITVRCMMDAPPPTTTQDINTMMVEVREGMTKLRQQLLIQYNAEGEGNRVADGLLIIW